MADDPSLSAHRARPAGKSSLLDTMLQSWQAALPNADLTSVSVSITVSRLAAIFNRGAEELSRQFGFGYGELEMLFYLLSVGRPFQLRPSDLTKGSFVTSGAITGRIDRLAKVGLVTRIASVVDRRELVVRLTRDGEKLARRLQKVVALKSTLTAALLELSEERRAALNDDLRRLLSKMEAKSERKSTAPARRKRS